MSEVKVNKRRVCVLGATGSVGGASLQVLRTLNGEFEVGALAANRDDAAMEKLCREFKPKFAALADEECARRLKESLRGENITIGGGANAVAEAADNGECGTVIAAVAGSGGAESVLRAAYSGRRVLLANKEALILCGALIMRAAKENGGEILPVDSEHCGLFELLAGGGAYSKLWLTASGGAARDIPLAELDAVTPEQALAHPNWAMGEKITIDSATMMNKVLEIIEASVLFNADSARIGVVLHRQSTAHALVEYADGSMTMQMSAADMRLPLARMLCWREHPRGARKSLSWAQLSAQQFEEPDLRRYPCLALAHRALEIGGCAPAVLSAANEAAVLRFLRGEIRFTDIARINDEVLQRLGNNNNGNDDLPALLEVDATAKRAAREMTL